MPQLIAIVVFVIVIVGILKSNKFKGYIGERHVNNLLEKIAVETGGLEMHDLMLEDTRSSSQLDNLLLTQKALYVIEVKNYKGMIFGSVTQQNWTMTVKHVNTHKNKRGKRYKKTHISKHTFYNPVKQNQTHINKINNLTDIAKHIPIINMVVFGKKATINSPINENNKYVISVKHLIDTINDIESKITNTLSIDIQSDIIDSLYGLNITDRGARKDHVKNIKLKYKK